MALAAPASVPTQTPTVPPTLQPLFRALHAAVPDAHLVGGAVRDLLTGRPPRDLDVVTKPDARAAAQAIAEALGGHAFPLDAARGQYRVVLTGQPADEIDVSQIARPARGPRAPRLHDQRPRGGDTYRRQPRSRHRRLRRPRGPRGRHRAHAASREPCRRSRCASCAPCAWPRSFSTRSTPKPPPPSANWPLAWPRPPANASATSSYASSRRRERRRACASPTRSACSTCSCRSYRPPEA